MKNILVTGANRGIGLEYTKQYLKKGYYVYAGSRSLKDEKIAELLKIQKQYPGQISIHKLDLTLEKDIQEIGLKLCNSALDILINNAGIFSGSEKSELLSSEQWHSFFQVNTIAPYLMIQAVLPSLRLGSEKKIINISSELGSIEKNMRGDFISYRASKSALNAVTKSIAESERKNHISVISIDPGWVRTDMGGPNGMLSPEESVMSMIEQIDKLNIENSGSFINYSGTKECW